MSNQSTPSIDVPFLCGKHNYDCDTATPKGSPTVITVWRDARPQPDWEALWITELAERAATAQGWPDPETGIHLAVDERSQQLFTGLAGLIRDELELGVRTQDTLESIWDAAGVEHSLPTSTLRSLLVRYGRFLKTQFDASP